MGKRYEIKVLASPTPPSNHAIVGKGYMIKISPFPPPFSLPLILSHCDMKRHKLLNQFDWKQGCGIRVEGEHHLFVGYSSWVGMVVNISKLLQLLWRNLFLGFCVCGYWMCIQGVGELGKELTMKSMLQTFDNCCSCYIVYYVCIVECSCTRTLASSSLSNEGGGISPRL